MRLFGSLCAEKDGVIQNKEDGLKAMLGGKVARSALGMTCLTSAAFCAFATQAAEPVAEVAALEEIIVTSRKTQENIQDVPLTVNVLTANALQEKGVHSVAEINGLMPNVVWETGGNWSRNRMTIRGIPSNQTSAGVDPGIGVYIDEVYQSNGFGFNAALNDIERIEVLKGPQGTLFGRNTTAGAISITTRRPSQDAYVEGDVEIGNYDLRQVRAVGNAPITEKIAVKLSGIYRERDGYDLNVVTGRHDINTEDHYGGRMQMLAEASDELELLVSADYYMDRGAESSLDCAGRGALGNLCPDSGFESLFDRRLYSNPPNTGRRENWGGSLTARWQGESGFGLTSITALRNLDASFYFDGDQTPVDLIRNGTANPNQSQFSQELRLTTPQDKPLRGVIGLYYSHESKDFETLVSIAPALLRPFGIITTSFQDALTVANQKTDSYAIFGQGSYDITSSVTAEIGLRYTHDKKDFMYEQQVAPLLRTPPLPPGTGLPIPVAPSFDDESWGALSGTASLSWRITDGALAYGRYSRGFKSGGYSATTASPGQLNTRPYDPEYLDSYELGVKYETADRRLRVNAAAFFMKYSDIQVTIVGLSRERFIVNAGKAESKGFELEASYLPIEGLTLDASLGVQKAEYTAFDVPPLAPGVLLPAIGNDLPEAPHVTASGTATYTFPLFGNTEGLISSTVIYRSNSWLEASNTIEKPEYALVNARIGIQDADGRWGVSIYGNNLTNVDRLVTYVGQNTTSAMSGILSAPRTYGVSLRVRY